MTVSNAFNRPDQLSPELRERVLAKAQELGYGGPDPRRAHAVARPHGQSSASILDAPLTLAFSDPAAVQLLHGVATVCEERELGMSLVPRIAGQDAELVRTALVDGFVVYCMGDDDPRRAAMIERRLPYALIDHAPGLRRPDGQHRRSRRRARHRRPPDRARPPPLRHRARLGQPASRPPSRRSRPCSYHVDRERLRGWRDGVEAAGVAWGDVALASAPGFDQETGRVAGGKLLDRADRPTAIVCTSDVMALGVLQAARRSRRHASPPAVRHRLRRHPRSRRTPASPPSASRTRRRAPRRSGSCSTRRPARPRSSSPPSSSPVQPRPPLPTGCSPPETPTWTRSARSTAPRAPRAARPRRPPAPPLRRVHAAAGLRHARPRAPRRLDARARDPARGDQRHGRAAPRTPVRPPSSARPAARPAAAGSACGWPSSAAR